MLRVFSLGTVVAEALSSAWLASQGTLSGSYTTQALAAVMTVLPVATLVTKKILAHSGRLDGEIEALFTSSAIRPE